MKEPEEKQTSPVAQRSPQKPSRLERIKDVVSVLQSVVTITAIIGAGIWFFMRAEVTPKANISHTVTHKMITDDWIWVHVAVNISNPGVRRLDLASGDFRIQGILPLEQLIKEKIVKHESIIEADMFVDWPSVNNYGSEIGSGEVLFENVYENHKISIVIDPGESGKKIVEFLVPAFVETVRIYSYLYRELSFWEKVKIFCGFSKKEKPGWYEVSIYDIKK